MTALSRLKEHGECVAIIPRSWTNGEYFTPFRKWVFDNFSLDSFHIYNSRSEIFSDTSVLQEIMIVKFSRKKQGKLIRVSTSNSKNDAIDTKTFSATELISRNDRILRMSPSDNSIETTISDFKLCPSTGKIVDFRSRERIYHTYAEALADSKTENQIFRLIYAGNLKEGTFVHPREIGKSQWFRADQKKSFSQLIQPGIYVLVKRFTTKEEPRRVVTLPLQTSSPIALENHINFIHSGTPRTVISLPSLDFAKGLSIWLNSIYIDNWFRNASGSTQVNASDIKSMPCLSEENLISLGKYWKPGMKQEEVEERVRLYL